MPKTAKNKEMLRKCLKESTKEPLEHRKRAMKRVLAAWDKKMKADAELRSEVLQIKEFLEQ